MTVAVARNPYATNVADSLTAAAVRLGVPVRLVDLASLRLGIRPPGDLVVTDSGGPVAADSLAPCLLFGFPAAVHALRALARTAHAQNPVDGVRRCAPRSAPSTPRRCPRSRRRSVTRWWSSGPTGRRDGGCAGPRARRHSPWPWRNSPSRDRER